MPENLGPICRRHHNLKTHHGYQLANNPTSDPGGGAPGTSWTWTTPAGLHHTRTNHLPLRE